MSKKPTQTLAASSGCCWFVSRHQGAIDWICTQNIKVDHFVAHLDTAKSPKAGDTVIGNLPVHIIATLNRQGVRFVNLQIRLNAEQRGKEVDLQGFEQTLPSITEFLVWEVDHGSTMQV
jgi:CRISPR-associated protein Csx16